MTVIEATALLELVARPEYREWAVRVGGWSDERFDGEAWPTIMRSVVERGQLPSVLEAARLFGWGSPQLLDRVERELSRGL